MISVFHQPHAGEMSHLLGGRIENWASRGSQDVVQQCGESCFLWRHCQWLCALGGVLEHIKVRRLASLYAEDMSARPRTRVISVAVWFVCVGSGVRISRVVEDVSDLSGLSDVPTILFRKETAFAKKMAILWSVSR